MSDAMKRVPAVKGLGLALEAQAGAKPSRIQKARQAATEQLKDARVLALTQLEKVKGAVKAVQDKTLIIIRDPSFKTMTVKTGTGVVVLGTAGGAFGSVSGVVIGSAAGLIPALFTFGLSVPAGAVIGGSSGLFLGACTGGAAGGLTGFTTYKYQAQIDEAVLHMKVWLDEKVFVVLIQSLMDYQKWCDKTCDILADRIIDTAKKSRAVGIKVKENAQELSAFIQEKAAETSAMVKSHALEVLELATTTRLGVTSSTAVVGGAVAGVAGGAMGALTGAAAGVVPAIFTFGLSIPVGACVGLCMGAAAGGSAGALGGGTAGFAGFTYRKELSASASYVKSKAQSSASQVTKRVKSFVAGTGGTA